MQDVNGRGDTLLVYVAIGGSENVAKYLVEELGVDVNKRGKVGYSSLEFAVMNKRKN